MRRAGVLDLGEGPGDHLAEGRPYGEDESSAGEQDSLAMPGGLLRAVLVHRTIAQVPGAHHAAAQIGTMRGTDLLFSLLAPATVRSVSRRPLWLQGQTLRRAYLLGLLSCPSLIAYPVRARAIDGGAGGGGVPDGFVWRDGTADAG